MVEEKHKKILAVGLTVIFLLVLSASRIINMPERERVSHNGRAMQEVVNEIPPIPVELLDIRFETDSPEVKIAGTLMERITPAEAAGCVPQMIEPPQVLQTFEVEIPPPQPVDSSLEEARKLMGRISFKGLYRKSSSDPLRAFLDSGGEFLMVAAGDLIFERIRVISISRESITLFDEKSSLEVTLSLR